MTDVPIDVVRAESSRFRHPLLLLHGWWTGAWIWRGFASYLAHRGWDAFAPSFLGSDGALDAHDRLRFVRRWCDTLPAPPVIVAHEAGVATATMLARAITIPALVLLTPLVLAPDGGDLGLLADRRLWWARMGAARVPPPGGQLGSIVRSELGADAARLASDSGSFFRTVLREPVAAVAPRVTSGLVVSSRNDPLTPLAHAERLAASAGWTTDVLESAGHFPMLTPGWERVADHVHRWIVRALGADLLAFLDDAASEP